MARSASGMSASQLRFCRSLLRHLLDDIRQGGAAAHSDAVAVVADGLRELERKLGDAGGMSFSFFTDTLSRGLANAQRIDPKYNEDLPEELREELVKAKENLPSSLVETMGRFAKSFLQGNDDICDTAPMVKVLEYILGDEFEAVQKCLPAGLQMKHWRAAYLELKGCNPADIAAALLLDRLSRDANEAMLRNELPELLCASPVWPTPVRAEALALRIEARLELGGQLTSEEARRCVFLEVGIMDGEGIGTVPRVCCHVLPHEKDKPSSVVTVQHRLTHGACRESRFLQGLAQLVLPGSGDHRLALWARADGHSVSCSSVEMLSVSLELVCSRHT